MTDKKANNYWNAEWEKRGLPEHPMVPFGYTSVGCKPCTALPGKDSGKRSGRWAQFDKQECGIHSRPEGLDGPTGGI